MKRTLALGAVWIASAAAAVGLGLLAVSLVDASASPGTRGAAATLTSTPIGATPTPAPSGGSLTGEQATVAGTVFANCAGGVPVLAGAPAAGWWVDDSDDPGQVQFENGTQKLEVHAVCGPDGPQFAVEGPHADDGGAGTPAPTPTHDAGDDSSGRDGGGHGSDDSGSDDSGGGGHGSDD